MPESDKSRPDPHSKTQRKHDMLALQKLGQILIDLSPSQLEKLSLPKNLLEAIELAHRLKSHEAKRRHLQYIGRIMRDIDPQPIQDTLSKIRFTNEQWTVQLHKTEQWRENLISGGDDILQKFLEEYPQSDRQQLRQLVRNAKNDREKNKNSGSETKLFRYLRELVGRVDN